MTTFSTHLNEQSNNLAAFPIPSFSQNLQPRRFLFESEKDYNDKTYANSYEITEKYRNVSQKARVVKLSEIPEDTAMNSYGHSFNRDLHKPKSLKLVNSSCSMKEQSTVDYQKDFSNRKVDAFKIVKENNSTLRAHDSMAINKASKTCSTEEKDILQASNAEVLNKQCMESSDVFKVLRENTFVIEPSQNSMAVDKIKRPYIDEHKSKRTLKNVDNKHGVCKNISDKRQSTALNKNKTHNKNPSVKRVAKKAVVSVAKARVTRNNPLASLQKSKNTVYVKGCSNLLDLDQRKEDSKIFVDATISSRVLKKETKVCKTQNILPTCHVVKDKLSETTASLPPIPSETSVMSKRKLSFSRYPVTTSSHSDSKIPRINRKSFEVSVSNSFCEEATSCIRKVPISKPNKTAASGETPTKIPVNDRRNNLSTLDISINDSCFLTPNRNAMLTPNSTVWMSGNKYFDSHSPKEEETFNKRESIAMILKSKSGHVQAKVHLYDDLIRESTDLSPSVPSHSTPTTKFRRLSSSQSLKSTPKQKTNAQHGKSASTKTSVATRSHSLRKEKSLKSYDPTKFTSHMNTLSPIKSNSLKDVTNTSVVINESKNSNSKFQTRDESGSVLEDGNAGHPIKRRKPKGNSFSGNTNQKFVRKVSRSESSPGCPRPYLRVACLIQE